MVDTSHTPGIICKCAYESNKKVGKSEEAQAQIKTDPKKCRSIFSVSPSEDHHRRQSTRALRIIQPNRQTIPSAIQSCSQPNRISPPINQASSQSGFQPISQIDRSISHSTNQSISQSVDQSGGIRQIFDHPIRRGALVESPYLLPLITA